MHYPRTPRLLQLSAVTALCLVLGGCSSFKRGEGRGPVAVQRSDWRFHNRPGVELTTEHYLIRTTCKSPTLLEAMPGFLESCWVAYEDLLPTQVKPSEPMKTYLFQNRSEWEAFTEDFAPARADVYKKIRSGGYSERGTTVSHYSSISATLSILAHEGFHQFLELTRGRNIPPWLNEGLACNFESFELDADNRPVFRPDRNALRRGHLAEALGRNGLIPLKEILETHAGEQVLKQSADVRGYYAQEWALVLFLRQPAITNPYHDGFQELMRDLGSEKMIRRAQAALTDGMLGKANNGEAVFRAYITTDYAKFEADYQTFIKGLLNIKT